MSIRMPNAAPPGSLADSRVGAETFRRLRLAPVAQVVKVTPMNRRHAGSDDLPESTEKITTVPPEKTRPFVEQLAQLLRDDRLYTAERTDLVGWGDVELRLSDPLPNTQVILYLKQHRIRFSYSNQKMFYGEELLLDPIGGKLLDLIQKAAPEDAAVRRLTFAPLSPAPSPKLPAGIPSDVLRQVRSVRPGMRRADALRILRPEGGLHGRLERQFLHPKPLNEQGVRVKVTIHFVPAATRIRWLEGVGYPIDMVPAHTLAVSDVRNDDIVIRVSEPFLQLAILR